MCHFFVLLNTILADFVISHTRDCNWLQCSIKILGNTKKIPIVDMASRLVACAGLQVPARQQAVDSVGVAVGEHLRRVVRPVEVITPEVPAVGDDTFRGAAEADYTDVHAGQ